MVPFRFPGRKKQAGASAKLAPAEVFAWLFAAGCFAYGLFFLTVLTDWPGFVIREGYTTYGAARVRAGEWPYRDFFFVWTPGVLALHALLQAIGASVLVERGASLLVASLSLAFVLLEVRSWRLRASERALLAGLLFLWSFSLWSVPYSTWFAVCAVLAGLRLRGRSWAMAGVLFALGFWFKQNVGLLAAAGAILALAARGDWRALGRFVAVFAGAVVGPFAFGWLVYPGSGVVVPAVHQIFLFPLKYVSLMKKLPPGSALGNPLVTLGLWLGSLYLSKSAPLPRQLARLLAVAHASHSLAREGMEYFTGLLTVTSLGAWLAFAIFWSQEEKSQRREMLVPGLVWFGIFLQVYLRADFAHFLFVFPLAVTALTWSLGRIHRRYPAVPARWAYFPLYLLLVGGLLFQGRLLFARQFGERDPAGLYSYGESHRLDEEMASVRNYLYERGLREGDPVLVVPYATTFYRFAGLRNPTPHHQFFPGYVEAFGDEQKNILPELERAGGRFVVVEHGSGFEQFLPDFDHALRARYVERKHFPYHFSVWERTDGAAPPDHFAPPPPGVSP